MTQSIDPIILSYAKGEISAAAAAELLGARATVADVFVLLREAGLEPPHQSPKKERAELAHARAVLGLA